MASWNNTTEEYNSEAKNHFRLLRTGEPIADDHVLRCFALLYVSLPAGFYRSWFGRAERSLVSLSPCECQAVYICLRNVLMDES
jgi:hypothetical protein